MRADDRHIVSGMWLAYFTAWLDHRGGNRFSKSPVFEAMRSISKATIRGRAKESQ